MKPGDSALHRYTTAAHYLLTVTAVYSVKIILEHGVINVDGKIINANVCKNMQSRQRLTVVNVSAVSNYEHSPAQGFFLLEGRFSCQCCLLEGRFGSALCHLETTLIVIEAL